MLKTGIQSILTKVINNTTAFDYFVRDHLGNIRMVLTDEQKTDVYPPASMETAQSTIENLYYSNINTTRIAKPAGYPTDTYTNPNNYVAKTNGSGNKIGPSLVLKVMVGDGYSIRVSSWYKTNGATPGTPANPLTDLVAAMLGSVGGASSAHGGAGAIELQSSGIITTGATNFLSTQIYNSSRPKAFINWILLDEQFKYYAGGFEQVGSDEELKIHTISRNSATKSGYLYVFACPSVMQWRRVSNETTNIPVYFDNLQVTHYRGPVLEETHYYPFGLTMAGISSKALSFGEPKNKEKTFQGQRFDDELGLNWVQFKWRNHDPQIGRFIEIDPLSEKYEYNSTYAFSENKVTNHVELEGLEAVSAGSPREYLMEGFRQWFSSIGNLFSGSAEAHISHEVEVKTEVKTPVGTVSNTTTTTVAEKKFEIKSNLGDFFGNRAKSPFEINITNKSLPKVETQSSATIKTEGAPIKVSTKTTVDENGKSQTTAVGTGANIDLKEVSINVSASAFYKEQISGLKAGQFSYGVKFAADATFVHHTNITIDQNIKVKTTDQTKVGGSIQLNVVH